MLRLTNRWPVYATSFLLILVTAGVATLSRIEQAPPDATRRQAEESAQGQYLRLAIATTERREPCSNDMVVSLDNIEEFDWRSCITDLKAFWADLHIKNSLDFNEGSSLSNASSIFGDLDGDGVDERILRLEFHDIIRFIVLKHMTSGSESMWKKLAYLDAEHFHLDPAARVVSNGRGQWLAISFNEEAWGTGLFQESEKWYALKNGALVEVLDFPTDGHWERFWRPNLLAEFKTEVRVIPFDGAKDRVEVTFTADSCIGYRRSAVDCLSFKNERKVTFSKSPNFSKFEFDPSMSEISKRVFTAVYDVNRELTNQVAFEFADDQLAVFAESKDNDERQLLREFLAKISDSPRKRELIRLIERAAASK
jgi:hypothetical protein